MGNRVWDVFFAAVCFVGLGATVYGSIMALDFLLAFAETFAGPVVRGVCQMGGFLVTVGTILLSSTVR